MLSLNPAILPSALMLNPDWPATACVRSRSCSRPADAAPSQILQYAHHATVSPARPLPPLPTSSSPPLPPPSWSTGVPSTAGVVPPPPERIQPLSIISLPSQINPCRLQHTGFSSFLNSTRLAVIVRLVARRLVEVLLVRLVRRRLHLARLLRHVQNSVKFRPKAALEKL